MRSPTKILFISHNYKKIKIKKFSFCHYSHYYKRSYCYADNAFLLLWRNVYRRKYWQHYWGANTLEFFCFTFTCQFSLLQLALMWPMLLLLLLLLLLRRAISTPRDELQTSSVFAWFGRLKVINMRNRPCKNWCHINSHGMQQIISSKNICNDNLANQWQIEITTTTWKNRMKRIFLSLMFKNTWITTKTQGQKIVIVLPWLNSDHDTHTFTDMQNMLGLISKQLW